MHGTCSSHAGSLETLPPNIMFCLPDIVDLDQDLHVKWLVLDLELN